MSDPSPQRQTLFAVIDHAVSAARRRLWLRALVDAVLAAVVVSTVAALAAGATLRGDLAASGWKLALALTTLGAAGFAWHHARRQFGTRLRAARAIAAHRAPLGPSTAPGRDREYRRLRHELLGATELCHDDPGDTDDDRLRHRSSAQLAEHYVADVAHRWCATDVEPARALPGPRWKARAIAAAVCGVAVAIAYAGPLPNGIGVLIAGVDARPPAPPQPMWSALRLTLHYPEHTGRPDREVPNPSGALRVPAGTEVSIDLEALGEAEAIRVVLNYDADELTTAPAPEITELSLDDPAGAGRAWSGSFVARGTGTWTVVLLDDADDAVADASRRSAALALQEEADRPPEIELLPLPQSQREVRETDQVEVRLVARDDFGLRSATLVYQLPDGEPHYLPIEGLAGNRRLRKRYDWDISQIPVVERSEVLYWVEVRDNDPGLGLRPLPDPPGKLTRSATQRLVVRDDEAEHGANIVKLRDLRDLAVDQLAARMTTRAFGLPPGAPATASPPPITLQAALARDLLFRGGQVLARLAEAIDALSVDTLAAERDIATLTEVHRRLSALHKTELSLHEALPPGSELTDPEGATAALAKLAPHNQKDLRQLEDEIIRLDDLVDGQLMERLEALVARLEATQRKLVDLLEQLAAGDESVRPQIEQLEQRRREDLRRIAEARAMLRQEVEENFMNLDAFSVLERMKNEEPLSSLLERGELSQALDQARGQLGEVQGLRDQVQQQLGEEQAAAELSPEERARMKLLRELSRLQDEQTNLRSQTQKLHQHWRDAVHEHKADESTRRDTEQRADKLREALDQVNDARLGREGRRGLEDAKEALDRAKKLASKEDTSTLDLAEAIEQATRGLEQAAQGSEASEREGKQTRKARDQAARLRQQLDDKLPKPSDALTEQQLSELSKLHERQQGLRRQAEQLLEDPAAAQLPAEGKKAMKKADRGMQGGAKGLQHRDPKRAVDPQSQAWRGLQEAIDSLRRGPPPPPPSGGGDASTEAERDRSLRDSLMEAMREDPPTGYDEPVQRYYEELLR